MTKTMSAIYNVTTTEWVVRDNGQVIAQGAGQDELGTQAYRTEERSHEADQG